MLTCMPPPQALGSASGSKPLALLAGTAVNQDGRSSSLTAPNGPAQQDVLRAALAAGRLEASSVTGLSMHGTGGLPLSYLCWCLSCTSAAV
jgi:3-oxoacyl-(acyl-carrier-protein) synthase